MDFKVMIASFTAVFLAEIADKTQLVGIGLASKSMKPVSVLAGSVLAYLLITTFSVFAAAALSKYINPVHLRYAGSILFIMMGILMFFDKL